jgi:hypothetical protein
VSERREWTKRFSSTFSSSQKVLFWIGFLTLSLKLTEDIATMERGEGEYVPKNERENMHIRCLLPLERERSSKRLCPLDGQWKEHVPPLLGIPSSSFLIGNHEQRCLLSLEQLWMTTESVFLEASLSVRNTLISYKGVLHDGVREFVREIVMKRETNVHEVHWK